VYTPPACKASLNRAAASDNVLVNRNRSSVGGGATWPEVDERRSANEQRVALIYVEMSLVLPATSQSSVGPHQHTWRGTGLLPPPSSDGGAAVAASGAVLHGRYLVKQHLGSGAFGSCWIAVDMRSPSRPIRVIKQMFVGAASEKAATSAEQEARLLAGLKHPHILRCFDAFVAGGVFNIVTELCDDGDLSLAIEHQRGEDDKGEAATVACWPAIAPPNTLSPTRSLGHLLGLAREHARTCLPPSLRAHFTCKLTNAPIHPHPLTRSPPLTTTTFHAPTHLSI
jgi:hypothetical protein